MLHNISYAARAAIEFLSILIIIYGILAACFRLAQIGMACLREKSCATPAERNAMIRLRLSLESTLMLGLQFLMAADIIGTITDPDLQGVLLLSVIVLLRVVLSFALSREVAEMDKQKRANELHEMRIAEVPRTTGE